MKTNKALKPEQLAYIWANKDRMAQWRIAKAVGCGQSSVSLAIKRMTRERMLKGLIPGMEYDEIINLHKIAIGK